MRRRNGRDWKVQETRTGGARRGREMEEEWGPRLAFACGLALAVAFRALCLEGEEKRSGGGRGEYAVPGHGPRRGGSSSLLL